MQLADYLTDTSTTIDSLHRTTILKQLLRGTRPRTRPHSEDETEVEDQEGIFPRSRTRRGEEFCLIPRSFRGRGETLENLLALALEYVRSKLDRSLELPKEALCSQAMQVHAPTSHPIAMILFSFCLGFVVPETQVWKDWNNPWKGPLDADCNEGILTGISSYHNNGQEDRKWKIQCSEVSQRGENSFPFRPKCLPRKVVELIFWSILP